MSVILVSLFYCRCLCCYDSSFFLVVGTGFSSVRVKNRCVQANLTLGFEVPILLLANILQCLANNEILIMSNACHVRNTENSVGHFEMIHKLEIVFTRAAPAFDNLFMGCVFNINTVHKTVEKLTFQAFY